MKFSTLIQEQEGKLPDTSDEMDEVTDSLYKEYNKKFFKNLLPSDLVIVNSNKTFGVDVLGITLFNKKMPKVVISFKLLNARTYKEVLLHELIHVWQRVVLKKGDELYSSDGAHDRSFTKKRDEINNATGFNLKIKHNIDDIISDNWFYTAITAKPIKGRHFGVFSEDEIPEKTLKAIKFGDNKALYIKTKSVVVTKLYPLTNGTKLLSIPHKYMDDVLEDGKVIKII